MKNYYVVTFTIPNGVRADSEEEAKVEAIRTLNECIRNGYTDIDELNITNVRQVRPLSEDEEILVGAKELKLENL